MSHAYIPGCGCVSCFEHRQLACQENYEKAMAGLTHKEKPMQGSIREEAPVPTISTVRRAIAGVLSCGQLSFFKPYVVCTVEREGVYRGDGDVRIGSVVIKVRAGETDYRVINVDTGQIIGNPCAFKYVIDPSIDHVRIG